jgi:lipopolysaccharide transport system ATP-binding protein
MSNTIIKVDDLGKSYLIGHERQQGYVALRDVVAKNTKVFLKGIQNAFSGKQLMGGQEIEEFWALKDINFEIKQGDAVGIIGRNGAGKSTLLKLLSRITEPTKGRIELNGRVASLLEVGTGFHPELSGRENIFLNGAILGMSRAEIKNKFDEIVDFSGVEKFLDTPVKHYSSGMYVRLAFAVAAHLEPEILVVDEVLAVGDAEFQKKCLGKMDDVTKAGRTVIFVSHDLSAITTLTQKTILLNKGAISYFGDTFTAIDKYVNQTNHLTAVYTNASSNIVPTITAVKLVTSEGQTLHASGKSLSVTIDIHMPAGREGMALAIQIFNQNNSAVVFNWLFDSETAFCRSAGKTTLTLTYKELNLYKGNYFLKVHLAETNNSREKFCEFDCCNFEVEMINQKAPEWGWQNNVCQYMEKASWEIL